jgi:hypothetical protein
MVRPMPLEAPVTTAVRPARDFSGGLTDDMTWASSTTLSASP